MPALLTASSTMMCPHGGTVTAVPGQTQAIAGAPVLCSSDSCTIAGCAFNISNVPSPCVTVQWVQAAARVQAGGNPVLNEASVGLCLAATQAPQGTVLIAATQPAAAGL
jgi:hypothetical protein